MTQTTINGYFTRPAAERIREKLTGKSFYNFEIETGNNAGNYTIVVKTELDDVTPEELQEMFYYVALNEL